MEISRSNSENSKARATHSSVPSHAAVAGEPCGCGAVDSRGLVRAQMVVEFGGISLLAALIKNSQSPEVRAEVAGSIWALSETPEFKVACASSKRPLRCLPPVH